MLVVVVVLSEVAKMNVMNCMKMRRCFYCFLVVLIIFISIILFFLCSKETTHKSFEYLIKQETTESMKLVEIAPLEEKQLSIFKNEFPETPVQELRKINLEFVDDICIVNNKKYTIQPTKYSSTYSTTYWHIDLSLLSVCGENGSFLVYSNDGTIDNDVLILDENGTLFLLVYGDVLSPSKYSCEDFYITDATDDELDGYINKLWDDHLSGNYFIGNLCIDEKPEYVTLQLKSHLELTYSIGYFDYAGDYFTRLPYNVPNQSVTPD